MLRKYYHQKVLLSVLLLAFVALQSMAQGWDVPADKKVKNSYVKFDATSAKEGEAVYTKNCQSCHGDAGKNNSLKSLKPTPPDLSSATTQKLSDGELFYILSTGRGLMPNFKEVLSETDRWKVISYIRSFNSNYVQVLSKTDPTKVNLVKITLTYDSLKNAITVKVIANEKSGVVHLKNAEVLLFVKRYFGRLQLDKTMRTNDEGVAVFNFEKNIPGDKTGKLDLIVKVNDENYGEIESVSTLKLGIPTDVPSLRANMAIWNTMAKAPVWIITLFSFGILVFVAFLVFVLSNLKKFKDSGNN
jgi:mono/diheme cytochrome c family protein